MARPPFLLVPAVLVPLLVSLACGGGADAGSPPATPTGPGAGATAAAAQAATHRLLGILDPDRGNMVAFALKVPVGWTTEQSFTRLWEGAVATPQVTLRLRSPDGATEIEYRPIVTHIWAEGPMTSQLRAQKRSFGMDPRIAPNEREPTTASAYARDVMLPLLAKEGLVVTGVRNALDAPETVGASGELVRRGSVDGTLADGQQVRVECRMQVASMTAESERYTSWSVVPSVTRTRGDLDAAHTHTRIAQDSIVRNPAWEAAEQAAAAKGQQLNREASRRQHEATMADIQRNTQQMTAAHQQRMADIQRQGEANTAAYEARMDAMDQSHAAWQERSASSDRQQAYTIDGIREEARYADPTTGQVVTAPEAAHAYRSADGRTLLATDAPLDPQQVDWAELQKLTQAEY